MNRSASSKTQPIDVSIIYTMMRDMRQEVIDAIDTTRKDIRDLGARVAIAQSQVITMTDAMKVISADAANSRVARLQAEVAEQERERAVLEKRLQIVDERLEEKKIAKAGALDTTGKMMAAAELTFEQREVMEKNAQDAIWAKRREQIITAVLISSSVGGVGAVLAFITWIVRFYLDNR